MIIRPIYRQKCDNRKVRRCLSEVNKAMKTKVALIAAVEAVNEDMQETIDAAVISKMSQRGRSAIV